MHHGGEASGGGGPRHPDPGYQVPGIGLNKGPLRYDKRAVRSERPIPIREVKVWHSTRKNKPEIEPERALTIFGTDSEVAKSLPLLFLSLLF